MPIVPISNIKTNGNNENEVNGFEERNVDSRPINQNILSGGNLERANVNTRVAKPISKNDNFRTALTQAPKPVKSEEISTHEDFLVDHSTRIVGEKKSKLLLKQRYTTYIEKGLLKKVKALESIGKLESATALINAAIYEYLEKYYH